MTIIFAGHETHQTRCQTDRPNPSVQLFLQMKKNVSKNKQKAREKEALRLDAAQRSFDDFYEKQYGVERWSTLVQALKQPVKHSCMPNKFADIEFVERSLQDVAPRLRRIPFLKTPCYIVLDETSASGNAKTEPPFPHPSKDPKTHMMNYYLLDPASVLAAESLDLKPQDKVLDLCAAPGGKTLVISQHIQLIETKESGPIVTTQKRVPITVNGSLVANELSSDRRLRLKTALRNYLPSDALKNVKITAHDGTRWSETGRYDKVLIDAPCSSERHLLHDPEELVGWTPGRTKKNSERQAKLLRSALRAVRPGGTVVYVTCSISDLENDGVVERVLRTDVNKKVKSHKRRKDTRRRQEEDEEQEAGQNEEESEEEEEEESEEDNEEEEEEDEEEESDDEDDDNDPLEFAGKAVPKTYPLGEATKFGWRIFPDVSDGFGPLFISVIQRLTEGEKHQRKEEAKRALASEKSE